MRAQDVIVSVQQSCTMQKTVFLSLLFMTSRLPFDLDFSASFSLTAVYLLSILGLVEGMLLKSIEKPKKEKSFFIFPPSSSKAIKVVCVYHPATCKYPHPSTTTTTTTRLQSKKEFPFHYLKKMNCNNSVLIKFVFSSRLYRKTESFKKRSSSLNQWPVHMEFYGQLSPLS